MLCGNYIEAQKTSLEILKFLNPEIMLKKGLGRNLNPIFSYILMAYVRFGKWDLIL